MLDARRDDATALTQEAEDWLRDSGADEHARWTQRFATSRHPDAVDAFDRTDDGPPTDPYRGASFVPAAETAPLLIHEVACTSGYTRLTWSRAQTSPEQALADAHTELRDDIGTTYLALDSGGGSDSLGRYTAFSRFAPAIPSDATELQFQTGAQTARAVRDATPRIR